MTRREGQQKRKPGLLEGVLVSFIRWLLIPNPGRDGIRNHADWGFFFISRAFIVVSAIFAAWGYSTEIFGRALVEVLGPGGYLIAVPFGTVFGIGASYFTAFGATYAIMLFRDGRWMLWLVSLVGCFVAATLVFAPMFYLFSTFTESSWRKLEAIEGSRDNTRASVDARLVGERADIERQLAGMERAVADATADRNYWREGARLAAACPEGAVCENVKEYQRLAGVLDDGRVRGVGACAACGETINAINGKLEAATAALAAAEAAAAPLYVRLDEIRAFESGDGEDSAAGRLNAAARQDAETHNMARGFRDAVRSWWTIKGWKFLWWGSGERDPRMLALERDLSGLSGEELAAAQAARDAASAELDLAAHDFSTFAVVGASLFFDVLNFLFASIVGYLATRGRDEDEDDDAPAPQLEDRSGQPFDPHGPQSEAAQVWAAHQQAAFVRPDAPPQPGETREQFLARYRPSAQVRAAPVGAEIPPSDTALAEALSRMAELAESTVRAASDTMKVQARAYDRALAASQRPLGVPAAPSEPASVTRLRESTKGAQGSLERLKARNNRALITNGGGGGEQ